MNNVDYIRSIEAVDMSPVGGKLTAIYGLVLQASGCSVRQGELVEIVHAGGHQRVLAEVIGMRKEQILLMPFEETVGLCLDSRVIPLRRALEIPVGRGLLGRTIDPIGRPLDIGPPLDGLQKTVCSRLPINPLSRLPISQPLETGVRAIDAFTPVGLGQRMGIMAGSGVGKSTLLSMIARNSDVDVVVIALVGERGREVGEFVAELTEIDRFNRTVVVAASAEQPAVVRRQAAFTATSIAESFRDDGDNVLLIMDSITRFAMAQREIGLATGESVGSRGYPASVFALLPPLLERVGCVNDRGSITAVYTVLVEGDDMNEPVTDHMRSLLDGHVVLSRELANRGQYPAIDLLQSTSRLSARLLSARQKDTVTQLRAQLALYAASQDFVELGAYESGNNNELDAAIKSKNALEGVIRQAPSESSQRRLTFERLQGLVPEVAE